MATGGLLEREAELDALETAIARSGDGQGSLVLVTGEAGIGKSSLVRALFERLRAGVDPPRVLMGACDYLLSARALGPFRDAAMGTGGPLEKALAAEEEIFEAVATELASGPGTTLLLIEDVHWADDATIDVLRFLLRRLKTIDAVVVLTFREDEIDALHPLRDLLGGLGGVPQRRIRLQPLTPGAVEALASESGRDGTALYTITGGNPFYVTEALAVPPGEVPVTVTDAVLARMGRLGEPCRRALEQLSVVPTRVGFELAEALLGAGLDVLAEAEKQGMVRVQGDGLAFRHELARAAIEQDLPALRRRSLHAAVLRLLRSRPDPDPTLIVHHAVAAGDVEAIIEYAPEAGRRAARDGSHRQALAQFEEALRHRDRFPQGVLARLVDDYAWELYNAHRFDEALVAGQEAVARYREMNDHPALADALVRLSRHVYMTGATHEALQVIDSAIEVGERAGAWDSLAYATVYRGAILALADRPAEAVPVLKRAHHTAVTADRGDLVALCLNYLGGASAELEGPGALDDLRASLAMSKKGGYHECTARAYTNLCELLYRYGLYDELEDCVSSGLAFSRERGFWSHAYNLEAHRCLALMRRGAWDAAEAGLSELLDTRDDPGMLFVYSVPPYARLLARRGAPEAGPLLAEAWQRANRQQFILGVAYAGLAYLEWAWLTGRPQEAAHVRDVLTRRTTRPGLAPIRGELMRYQARAGLGGTDFPGCPEPYAAGLRGDWRAAASAWERIGDPYEQALELAESGEPAPTVEALRILEKLGAGAAAGLVRDRLLSLGVKRPPRGAAISTRSHPAGLTRRQADVLALLVRGLTNAEIANRLVLSVRTVDHHVSAILAKLGVRSRREAVEALAEPAS